MKRWQLGLVALASLVLVGGGLYWYSHNSKERAVPTYGYVRMDVAEKTHPLYPKYQEAIQALETMRSQYRAEQQMYVVETQRQRDALAKAENTEALEQSLQEEYQAKLALKETQLNGQLLEAYEDFRREYGDVAMPATAAKLSIVNLQLALSADVFDTPEERIEKEQELAKMLQEANPNLGFNNQAAQAKIDAAMKPLQTKAAAELKSYSEALRQEMKAKGGRKQLLAEAKLRGMGNLPDLRSWQTQWEQRFTQQEAKVKAIHDAILADIRTRVPAVAEARGLRLVLSQYQAQYHMVDLTDAVVASYP